MSMLRPPFSRFLYNTQTTASSNTYVFVQPANALGLERSNSPETKTEKEGSEPTTPTARKDKTKMESGDFQVPFPPVQAKRSTDWEREQALRSPTLSAHSNTSGSHTTAPTSSTATSTAITIPGAYDSGSASGGSGVDVTPTRETVKAKRGSAGSTSGGSNPGSQQGFYPQLPPNPSPYRATPPSSPQPKPGASPSQPRQAAYTALPTLPDSPPPDRMQSPPFIPHQGPPTLTAVANLMQAQTVPISPVHPRPMNRTQAGVLGPTKMAESWTAAPPPEDLNDEVQERKAHLTSARDGAAQRGHRPTGSLEIKDAWQNGQNDRQNERQNERQNSVRRPKLVTQPPAQPPAPRVPIATRYETMSPPPMRDPHPHGLHLDLHEKAPDKPPIRVQTGRGPSPPNHARGRAATAMTPPHTYDDPYRGRSSSHASYTQPKAPPPPAPQAQWGTRAPGTGIVPFNEDLDHDEHEHEPVPPPVQQGKPADQTIVDWANHTQSQHPLSHPNQPPPNQPGERTRGRSRSRGRADTQPPLMDPATMYSQQQQQHVNGSGRPGGRSPLPAPAAHGSGSGSSEAEDLKTPRSPSVPLPGESYAQRFGGYGGQFSVGPPTVNHIYTQDVHNGHLYSSMGFAQSQYALHQMGAGTPGMAMQMQGHPMNGRQVNGYGYPQDLSSSASGSFLDGWANQGYPNARPSAPVPPTPSTGTAPTSGDMRNGHPHAQLARAQAIVYPQSMAYPAYSYAMDPYRAPSVVSSFMASPFSHNPFLPPVEPQSTQSSPSHQPIGLPYAGMGKRFPGARMGTKGRRRRMMEEFRPESTVPNDTASEAETEGKRAPDGAETEFETETEMEEVWLEESEDDELENEFHPTYFVNPAKRKRRFEHKWEQMVKLFREIDRETDATMILAAAPPDQHQTHLLLSRAILRDTNYSHIAQEARSIFSDISIARRRERTEALRRARQERQRKKAADDRMATMAHLALTAENHVGSGSDETSVPASQPSQEQDLRMALDAARASLQEMRRVYDEMETRHREESNRRKEESLSLEKLLTSLLGSKQS